MTRDISHFSVRNRDVVDFVQLSVLAPGTLVRASGAPSERRAGVAPLAAPHSPGVPIALARVPGVECDQMYFAAAVTLVAILCGLALLHVYWAAGGRLIFDGTIPTRDGHPLFVPGPGASVIVALALLAAAAASVWRAELVSVDAAPWGSRVAVGLVSFAFATRAVGDFQYIGFLKRVRGSLFARRDTLIYTPLCTLVAVLAGALAVGSP